MNAVHVILIAGVLLICIAFLRFVGKKYKK